MSRISEIMREKRCSYREAEAQFRSELAAQDALTLLVFGAVYPVLEDLGHGWFLVAHPNGPAIARCRHWEYLGHLARIEPDTTPDCVPSGIRYRAVDALMRWAAKQPTWPKSNE